MRFASFIYLISTLVMSSAFSGEVLFINMNNAKSEINAAQKAASERGDSLRIIPEEGKRYSPEQLKDVVNKYAFKSLIISGHGGSGNFTGSNGQTSMVEVLDLLKNSKSIGVETLYLMGCYTGNKTKVMLWKDALPKVKFIAGFDSDAPLSTRPASPKYLYDLMKKESLILTNKDAKILKSTLDHIEVLKMVNAGLFIKCGPEEYSYVSKLAPEKRFSKFNPGDCVERMSELKNKYLEKINKYWDGELEPTTEDVRTGFLRQAYSAANQAEHCFDEDAMEAFPRLVPGSLFFLLFNKGFNYNFATYYRPQLKAILSEIEAAKKKDYANTEAVDRNKKINDRLLALKNDPLFIKKFEAEKDAHLKEYEKLVSQYPTLGSCLFSGRECNFPLGVITHARQLDRWKELKLESVLAPVSLVPLKIDKLAKFPDDALTILQNMISRPEYITRKDFLRFNEVVNGIQGNLEKDILSVDGFTADSSGLSEIATPLYRATNLFLGHPFSWHEVNPEEPVENPGVFIGKIKDKDLEFVLQSKSN